MGPYSHYVIASRLEGWIEPRDLQGYYWGAVAPDVRYLMAGMGRSQTHLGSKKILAAMDKHPELVDFLQGYLVHCLCDQLNLMEIIRRKFPFKLQQNKLSERQETVILEFFNILRVKPPGKTMSVENNTFLRNLGVSDEAAARFAAEVQLYITYPSLRSMNGLYLALGLIGNDRIDRYRKVTTILQQKWLQKNLILFGLQVGKVNEEIASTIRSIYPVNAVT